MAHQHGPVHLAGEIRQRLERRVRCGNATAKIHVRDTLLRQFVQGGHGELCIRVGVSGLGTDAEVGQTPSSLKRSQRGRLAGDNEPARTLLNIA